MVLVCRSHTLNHMTSISVECHHKIVNILWLSHYVSQLRCCSWCTKPYKAIKLNTSGTSAHSYILPLDSNINHPTQTFSACTQHLALLCVFRKCHKLHATQTGNRQWDILFNTLRANVKICWDKNAFYHAHHLCFPNSSNCGFERNVRVFIVRSTLMGCE